MGGEDEEKSIGFSGNQQSQLYYGTFQGVANYHPPPPPPHHVLPLYNPPPPVVGFPQPIPPPPGSSPYYYGYQSVPVQGYIAVAEVRPVRERRPCCVGSWPSGWFLFIAGFFLSAIPWYLGAFILLVGCVDPRAKSGYIACLIGAAVTSIAVIFMLTDDYW